jgi:hypothetical protein
MQNSTSFLDLAPTEADAAGVVGGAFIDLNPVFTLLGAVVSALVHVD